LPGTVAIIGAGPLGRWLALSAARAGFRVLLEDVMPANLHHAQEFLRRQLGPQICPKRDVAGSGEPEAGRSTAVAAGTSAQDDNVVEVDFVSTIEDAVRDADLAIDCVPDELESKLEIFWLLDRMAPPRTVLATPTTRLSIADLANCTYRPAQCIAIAQEASSLAAGAGREILLRTTTRTAPETVALVRDFWQFWQRLGFIPTFELDPAEPPAR
jgi:3-hydroxybutyryl-CoA dehydrogenase